MYVRAKDGAKPVRLHLLWDDLILGSTNRQAVRNTATKLLARPDLSRDRLVGLSKIDPEEWVRTETFELAKRHAYGFDALLTSRSEADAPVLPAAYIREAKAIAERQIMLAGYRLAEQVRRSLP